GKPPPGTRGARGSRSALEHHLAPQLGGPGARAGLDRRAVPATRHRPPGRDADRRAVAGAEGPAYSLAPEATHHRDPVCVRRERTRASAARRTSSSDVPRPRVRRTEPTACSGGAPTAGKIAAGV